MVPRASDRLAHRISTRTPALKPSPPASSTSAGSPVPHPIRRVRTRVSPPPAKFIQVAPRLLPTRVKTFAAHAPLRRALYGSLLFVRTILRTHSPLSHSN